jgi:choline-sulfatase
MTAQGPNILFIMSDQHVQKVAGCYGDRVALTPNLDRLAAGGVVFDNAYCPSPICTPSRMSTMTGQWPHEQGCWTLEDQLGSERPTWMHALGAGGYRPILAGRMHSVGPDQLHGFAERDIGDCSPNWMGVKRQDLGVLAGAQGPAAVSLERSGRGQSGYQVVDMATTDAACARLRSFGAARRDGDAPPFCLMVGLVLPHCPFVAWREDYDLFDGRVGMPTLPRPAPGREHPWLAGWRRTCGIDAPDPAAVLRARTAYYGLVRRLDIMIGQMLDTLRDEGLADDTLVVYCSDHGEQIGERGLWWKNTFYDESAKVPLIMAWPGRILAGTRCARVVSMIDLNATFVAATGSPALPRSRGRDLLAIAIDPGHPWHDETFSEYVTDIVPHWTGPEATQQRMIRSGRYKLVHVNGYRPLLFDLENDPFELEDRGDDPAFAGIRTALSERVLAGWDPDMIAREVALRRREKDLLAAWGRSIQPASTLRFEIAASDSWLEPRDV